MWMKKKTDDDFMMIKMIKKPADRASYFTVITQFISTQQTKIVWFWIFPFRIFLDLWQLK